MAGLAKLVRQHFGNGRYVPNLAASQQPVVRVVTDMSSALTILAMDILESGGDLSAWGEEEWRKVLTDQLDVDELQMSSALEQLAGLGVVDNTNEE